MPKVLVKTVALYFRDNVINGADLKIFYEPLDVWHGEEDVATFENTGGVNPAQNTNLSNLFDDSIYSFFMSDLNFNDQPEKHLLTTFEV